jgi:hypothetical protein
MSCSGRLLRQNLGKICNLTVAAIRRLWRKQREEQSIQLTEDVTNLLDVDDNERGSVA